MSNIPGILLLILGLLISVGIHELGHLVPAKKFGVKVPQYFIGFGPTIWSTVKNGTEYGIKAIPLGGYVRLAGMLAPARAGVQTHKDNGEPTVAEEARQMSRAELAPGEEHRAMWRLSVPKKLAVMFGGPLTNLLLAGLCLAVVVSGFGVPRLSTTLGQVSTCIGTDSTSCSVEHPASPAAQAGLRPGDRIVSWGGVAIESWEQVHNEIASNGTEPTDVVVDRHGTTMTLTVVPVELERPVIVDGSVVTDADGDPVTTPTPFVGISPDYDRETLPLTSVPSLTLDLATATGKIVLQLPVHLWNTASDLLTGDDRDASGVVGIVGVADLAGNISGSESVQYSMADRASDLFSLLASLNMSLFVFNLIPLLPLDGGHIFGALVEGSRRKLAQLRGKPDPGPFDTARMWPLSQVVIIFFVAMTVLLIIADIVNPVF